MNDVMPARGHLQSFDKRCILNTQKYWTKALHSKLYGRCVYLFILSFVVVDIVAPICVVYALHLRKFLSFKFAYACNRYRNAYIYKQKHIYLFTLINIYSISVSICINVCECSISVSFWELFSRSACMKVIDTIFLITFWIFS